VAVCVGKSAGKRGSRAIASLRFLGARCPWYRSTIFAVLVAHQLADHGVDPGLNEPRAKRVAKGVRRHPLDAGALAGRSEVAIHSVVSSAASSFGNSSWLSHLVRNGPRPDGAVESLALGSLAVLDMSSPHAVVKHTYVRGIGEPRLGPVVLP
jgi:hypothetical protein